MTFGIALLSIVGVPLLFGYIAGRNQQDPFTVRGREYYR
jgi:hypothetical protein